MRGARALFGGVSFALGPGEALVVRGANGAGKSSLIRIAAGLLDPAAGGVEVTGDRALLSEVPALDGDLTLSSALDFWARIDQAPRDAVGQALDRLDLTGLAAIPVRYLSTGQRRRAGMARVLASGAPIWLLDEPANGLDAAATERLEAVLAGHRADGGIALVATHQPIALPGAASITLAGDVVARTATVVR